MVDESPDWSMTNGARSGDRVLEAPTTRPAARGGTCGNRSLAPCRDGTTKAGSTGLPSNRDAETGCHSKDLPSLPSDRPVVAVPCRRFPCVARWVNGPFQRRGSRAEAASDHAESCPLADGGLPGLPGFDHLWGLGSP